MKIKRIFPMMLATTLLASGLAAHAEPHHDERGYGHQGHSQPNGHPQANSRDYRGDNSHSGDYRHDNGRAPQGNGYYKDKQHPNASSHYRPGQPRPYQDWRAGQRLPAAYRSQAYYVNDWRNHGLRQPPKGQRWVGVNGDYILVSIATNIIAQVLLGR